MSSRLNPHSDLAFLAACMRICFWVAERVKNKTNGKTVPEIIYTSNVFCLLRAICLISVQQLAAGMMGVLRGSSSGDRCSRLCFATLRMSHRVEGFSVHPKSRHTWLAETDARQNLWLRRCESKPQLKCSCIHFECMILLRVCDELDADF